MGNFDFVRATIPSVHEECARAESYLASDPRAACIYGRRAAELLVGHLYRVLSLATPYKDDLAALINDPAFKAEAGVGITAKLNLIRKLGNSAVHDNKPIPVTAAQQLLTELHHTMIWAAFRYSPNPEAAPTKSRFDPNLAKRAAPLSRTEVAALAARFKAQDEQHAKALEEKDGLLAARDAEIAALKAEIAAAQANNTASDDHDYSEAETRLAFIDLLLREAGWPLDQDRDREYEVSGMPNSSGTGYVDYVLWGADGRPLAVVEAKRTTASPQVGQQQAKLYADCLESEFGRRPVIFYTNGYEHWLWDDAAGYPPREVDGFYTDDQLELMVQRRTSRLELTNATVNSAIAGRDYQIRAIKAIGESFDQKEREALLVMATGTGKTRTIVALVDQLMKYGWVKRALFLADRTALVTQAVGAFKEHLPSVTTVNLVTEKNSDGRVFVSTYPTMMGLIDEMSATVSGTDSSSVEGARRFGPGYFDLVIIDEAHRSVYARYGAIFEYFDSLLVGLTATPKDEVDHNTYRLFHLEDGMPTDVYELQRAVDEKHLVPPKSISVGTQFLRAGIKYVDLSDEEKDDWDALDWGDDGPPTEVGAEEINRFLFNEDTVDKVLETLMTSGYRVAGGDRLGKTIIFAKSQAHAEFICARFDLAYPELAGEFARVITHATTYSQSLIESFKDPNKAPHIAISVDMLDTGIDVPEILNLVFFKLVHSKSKFWQMIGRGTRLRPDIFGPGKDKKDFLVFDFCGNLEFFSQDLRGSQGQIQMSLSQRIFEARLSLIAALAGTSDTAERELRESTAQTLCEIVAGMNLSNFLVRKHRRAVEQFSLPGAWASVSQQDIEDALALANLPSSVRDTNEDAKRFDVLVLRRQLAQLEGDAVVAERCRQAMQEIASSLLSKTTIPSVAQQAELLEAVAGDEWWTDVTLPLLEVARLRIRGLVQFIERSSRNPVYTDFEDTLNEPMEVTLPGVTPGTNLERFRAKITAYLIEHNDHIALQRLRRNKQLTTEDIASLEEMLLSSGAGQRGDIEFLSKKEGGLGLFVRSLVGLDQAAASEAFAHYLDNSRFSAVQVRFIGLVVDELTKNGVMEPRRLFESPYNDQAPAGAADVFDEADVDNIVEILATVKQSAMPAADAS